MKPIKRKAYSRKAISKMLGGSIQWYLPMKNDKNLLKITCGCFRLDLNPNAPKELLIGEGNIIQKTAKILSKQEEPIPVFIKKESDVWEYIGDYVCVDYSTNSTLLKQKEKLYPERGIITGVLRLKEV